MSRPRLCAQWIAILGTGLASGGLRTLSTEELSGDVQGLGADDDDLLAAKQLLGDNAGQTAQEVALAIDDDLWEAEAVSIADRRDDLCVVRQSPPPSSR